MSRLLSLSLLAFAPGLVAAHPLAAAHSHDFFSDLALPAAITVAVVWLARTLAKRLKGDAAVSDRR